MNKIIFIFFSVIALHSCAQEPKQKSIYMDTTQYNPLSKEEKFVILQKGTERAFTGAYTSNKQQGTYLCKQCNSPLYRSEDKFELHCGWPSFDDEIKGAVTRKPDADGSRKEIICSYCQGHLGHVFEGEGLTDKNIRHCVNSISLQFIPAIIDTTPERAIFAAGCFWGVQYFLSKEPGVLYTRSGYIGGTTNNPTYEDVCSHKTGHAEAVEVFFDSRKTDFETLAKLFFEIHDFTQIDRQGPDIGDQYRTEVFYTNEQQKEISEKLFQKLAAKGYKVATHITKASIFWPAELYHQDYYDHKGGRPYCHIYKKIF